MVINEHRPKQKEVEPQDIQNQRILNELKKVDSSVLLLAYMYARGYDLGGEDVTKAWTNAVRNTQIIETAYRRGYEDCQKDIKEKKTRDFFHKVLVDLKE